jgi:hypothetical protein
MVLTTACSAGLRSQGMSYIHRYSTYSVLLFRVLTVAVACSMTDVITYKL